MSSDEKTTKELIETLEDGKNGYAQAADRLADSDQPELSATMRTYSEQRAGFAAELRGLAADYGDQIDESGSLTASLHRTWMSLKDSVTGSDPSAVLDVAEQGEDHAVSEYDKALKEDISAELRTVIDRQYTDIKAAHDAIRALRNQN